MHRQAVAAVLRPNRSACDERLCLSRPFLRSISSRFFAQPGNFAEISGLLNNFAENSRSVVRPIFPEFWVASGDAALRFPDVTPANLCRILRLSEKHTGKFGTYPSRNFSKISCRILFFCNLCLSLSIFVHPCVSQSVCFWCLRLSVPICLFVSLCLSGCLGLSLFVFMCLCLSFVSISLCLFVSFCLFPRVRVYLFGDVYYLYLCF